MNNKIVGSKAGISRFDREHLGWLGGGIRKSRKERKSREKSRRHYWKNGHTWPKELSSLGTGAEALPKKY